ncbi:SMC-Scp complex subunit ScpB [Rhizobium ruizarguesonis]
MAEAGTTKAQGRGKSRSEGEVLFDRELEDLPAELRWREWMMRVEAVIFASAEPVGRETLARVVGMECSIELLIDDLVEELRDRPYELVAVAGGWQHRTRPRFSDTIRTSSAATRGRAAALSQSEAMILIAIGYHQPITRGELSTIFGREVSRDTISGLRGAGFITSGPHRPTPGAPYTYVTTPHFLSVFGMQTLRDLPNIEALEDAGMLGRAILAAGEIPIAASQESDDYVVDDNTD